MAAKRMQATERQVHMAGTARAAFAYWEDRIAPVFDTTRRLLVVEAESGEIVGKTEETLPEGQPIQKVLRLTELRVDAVICGAISRQMQLLVVGYGIRVIPFVAGNVSEVVRAWVKGTLERGAFAMPGCGAHRKRGPGTGKREAPTHRSRVDYGHHVRTRKRDKGHEMM